MKQKVTALPPSGVDEGTLSFEMAVELLGRLLLNSIKNSRSEVFIIFLIMIISILVWFN